jgi:acyl dehydratase
MHNKSINSYTFFRSFTQNDFDRFANLSGDINPIHIDPQFSARTKFGRTVAHGMLLFSVLCSGLSKYFPGNRLVKTNLMFPSPTFTNEQIRIQLDDHSFDTENGLQNIEMKMTRPNGKLGCLGDVILTKIANQVAETETRIKYYTSAAKSYKGLQLGQQATTKRSFSAADLVEYTNLSGDDNPLYSDTEYARQQGLQNTPIPAGLLGGLISFLLGVKLPGRGTNWLKQSYNFLEPAYPGQQIKAKVEITRLRPLKDLVNLSSYCTVPEGTVVTSGESLMLVNDLKEVS